MRIWGHKNAVSTSYCLFETTQLGDLFHETEVHMYRLTEGVTR